MIKPPPLRPAVAGGFTLDDFAHRQPPAPRPAPKATPSPSPPPRRASFVRHCVDCPAPAPLHHRDRGRILTLHPDHGLLAAARAQAATDDFDEAYRRRGPLVERTLAWVVRGNGRLVRYRGVARNRLWLTNRCAAVNLNRLINLGLTHTEGWVIA